MCFKHKWEERSCIFTAGKRGFKYNGACSDEIERMIFGFTTILHRCKKCGILKEQQFVGNQTYLSTKKLSSNRIY